MISVAAEIFFYIIQHSFMMIKICNRVVIEGPYLNIIKVIYDKPMGFPGDTSGKEPV